MPHHTTTTITIRKPLLLAVVLGVVVLAAFSPLWSNNAFAQWRCQSPGVNICTGNYPTNICDGPDPDTETDCGSLDTCVEASICENGPTPTDKQVNEGGFYISGIATEAILWALIEILKLINSMLVIFVGLVAQLLDAAIILSLAGLSNIGAITIGWGITRDIANLFFIFILLVIAIATILRLEQYGAKQLLARLIIIALLINFSLVIAAAVVDASNIFALAFIGEISPVSDTIATVLQISKIRSGSPAPAKETEEIQWQTITSKGWTAGLDVLNRNFTTDDQVQSAAPVTNNKPTSQTIEFFWQATILVLMLVLIFVFVALSAMLLIRSVALIIIFVLAPLGFLAFILPNTRGFSTQWWQKLFSWSFFFPASAFMIYLSLTFGAQMAQHVDQGNAVMNTGMLFNYFVVVALLIGSLIVAKQMGIMGAAAAIGIGLGLAKRARGFAGRTTMGGVYATGRATARRAGEGAGRFAERLGTYGTLGRFAAKPFARLEAAGERQSDALKKQYQGSRNQFRAMGAATMTPQGRRAWRQAGVEQGYADLLTPAERATEYERATREHDEKSRRAIEAVTPAMAITGKTSPEEQRNAVLRATQGQTAEDIRTKMQAGQLGNEMVADAAILNYGEQKMEAAVERFPEELGPALLSAFNHMIDQIKADEAAAGRTITEDEAGDRAVEKFRKDNASGFKVVYKSSLMRTETQGEELQDLLRASIDERNKVEADKAEKAYTKKETDRGRTPSPEEIDVERGKAKKIEI